MNGIVPGHMTAVRYAFILGSFALYFLLKQHLTLPWAIGYFAMATVLHYAYLGGMFRQGGWSRTLRQRHPEDRAFLLHESWMAFAFCHNALSTGFLCYATEGLPAFGFSLPDLPSGARWTAFGVLVALGLGAKVWATVVVGLDAYYYRDLFLERFTGQATSAGPYRYFDNPMYTIGHLHGYAIALLSSSPWGLLGVAVNQALVLTFNHFIEQPHLQRIGARSQAA